MATRHLKFRYTLGAHDDAVKAFLVSHSPCVIIQHDADSEVKATHWHAWIGTSLTTMGFRGRWKKALPGVASVDYSIGEIRSGEEDVYVRYMCHSSGRGDPVVVVHCCALGYDAAVFRRLNLEFWDARKEFVKKKKQDLGGTVRQLKKWCAENEVDLANRRAVTVACVRMFVAQERAINTFYVDSVVCGVISGVPSGEREVVDKIMCRWENNFSG